VTDKDASQKTEASESRRDFLKKLGAAAGAVQVPFLLRVLEVRAAVRRDGAIIEAAAKQVESNAKRGLKGKSLLLTEVYKAKGGRNKEVLTALSMVDRQLRDANALRHFNPKLINRQIEKGITDYVKAGRTGVAAAKGNSQYRVRDSAARVMFNYGGETLKTHMNQSGYKIAGYNAPMTPMRRQMSPKMQTPSMKPTTPQMTPKIPGGTPGMPPSQPPRTR
jgi:hypothetical protein